MEVRLANPVPLAFVGLAAATLVASGLELRWISTSEQALVGLAILVAGPVGQGVAAITAIRAADITTATFCGGIGISWAAIGSILLASAPGSTSNALGTLLFVTGGALLASAISLFGAKPLPALVVATAGLRFVVTGVYEVTEGELWRHVAGIVGLVLCALAVLVALCLERRGVARGESLQRWS